MRRFSFRNIKENSPTLVEIIELHKQGYSSVYIGRKFHKDHSTILYWLNKTGNNIRKYPTFTIRERVFGLEEKTPSQISSCPFPQLPKYDELIHEKINHGSNYKQILISKHGYDKAMRILHRKSI